MVSIKDGFANWYIRNFLISRAQIFDRPGFVAFNLKGNHGFYSRQVIFSELFFSDLETNISNELGDQGDKLIYDLGKAFGVRFSLMSNLKKLDFQKSKETEQAIFLVVKFIEGTYAENISYKLDLQSNIIEFEFDNIVICRKSGKGYFLSAGGAAGIWSVLTGRDDIEAVHYACQGRGDPICKVIVGPRDELIKKGYKFFTTNLVENFSMDIKYLELNKIVDLADSRSLQSFLDSGFFSYKLGRIFRGDDRFFIIEASILYLLEKYLCCDEKSKKILEQVSLEYGKKTFFGNSPKDLIDFLSAFGFGKVVVVKSSSGWIITFDYFPWTKFHGGCEQVFIKNFIFGAMSKFIDFGENKWVVSSGFFGKGYSVVLR